MTVQSAGEAVVLFRKQGQQDLVEYYVDTNRWTDTPAAARKLDEELAKSLAGGLQLREPTFTYDTKFV